MTDHVMLIVYSAASLSRLLHAVGSRRKLLAVLIAYFDDSGAHGGPADVFTIGGWVAEAPRWTRLERVWDRALGWRVFHMVDFSHRRGDFKNNWSEKKRIQLVANLADSIRNTIIFGVAHSVILEDFKQVFAPDIGYQQLKKNIYGLMLRSCFDDIVDYVRVPQGESIAVVCEEAPGCEGFATECFYESKRIQGLEMFAGITFAPKNRFRALQAADMLAYENFKHVTNRYAKEDPMPVRKLLAALNKSRRCSLGYYNEAALRNLRARFERFPGNWLSS